MTWRFSKIEDYVKNNMSTKRWRHVQGVMETAKTLAERHGVDATHAELAALVHDVEKEQDLEVAKQILTKRGEDGYLMNSSKIWHAPIGAFVAREVFGIEVDDICNAIKFHTTGRAGMSSLEKVLFIADYTEPNRTFAGCVTVRDLWDELDRAVYEILKQKVEKVTTLGLGIHPDTLDAYEYYKRILGDDGI